MIKYPEEKAFDYRETISKMFLQARKSFTKTAKYKEVAEMINFFLPADKKTTISKVSKIENDEELPEKTVITAFARAFHLHEHQLQQKLQEERKADKEASHKMLGNILKQKREEMQLSISQLAKKGSLTENQIKDVESGKVINFSPNQVKKIADTFSIKCLTIKRILKLNFNIHKKKTIVSKNKEIKLEESKMSFSEFLKNEIEKSGSQSIAAYCRGRGISYKNMLNYLNSNTKPRKDQLNELADKMGVEIKVLKSHLKMAEQDKSVLGQTLVFLAEQQEMQKDEIARKLGISTSAVDYHQKGRYEPYTKNLKKYAQLFGVDQKDLIMAKKQPEKFDLEKFKAEYLSGKGKSAETEPAKTETESQTPAAKPMSKSIDDMDIIPIIKALKAAGAEYASIDDFEAILELVRYSVKADKPNVIDIGLKADRAGISLTLDELRKFAKLNEIGD